MTFEDVARERKWATKESAIRRQIDRRTGDLCSADIEIIESEVLTDVWANWSTIKKLKPFIRKSVGFKIYEFRRRKLRENLATGRDKHGNPIPGESRSRVLYYDPTPGGDDMEFVETLAEVPGPEQEIEDQMPEVRERLAVTFAALPEKQREIAVLMLIEELPLNVAATKLGIRPTIASSRLYQAKQSLRAGALRDVAGDWGLLEQEEGSAVLGSDWQGNDCRIGKEAAHYVKKQDSLKILDGVRA